MIPTWVVCCMMVVLVVAYHSCFRIIEKNRDKEMDLMEKMFRTYQGMVDATLIRFENDIDRLIEELSDSNVDDCDCEPEEDDIHLISAEEFYLTNRDYTKDRLFYAEEDATLRYIPDNEDERKVYIAEDDAADYIGDGLRFFGVRSNDPNVVYVRNNKLKTDFRVCKFGVC